MRLDCEHCCHYAVAGKRFDLAQKTRALAVFLHVWFVEVVGAKVGQSGAVGGHIGACGGGGVCSRQVQATVDYT